MFKKLTYLLILFSLLFLFSCKKEIEAPDSPEVPNLRTEDQLLKDSIYYYYKLYSLWEESVPRYTVISEFTDSLSSPSKVLDVLKSKTPVFPAYFLTGGTYDRFSYFTEFSARSDLSSNLKMDSNDGYGISFSIGAISDSVAYPFISMIEGGSPSDFVGITRSDMVLELNGLDLKIAVKCTSGSCSAIDAVKYNFILSSLRDGLNDNTMRIKVQKTDTSIKSHVLSFRSYEIDPLLSDTVFSFSNMNVGYFAYSSFEEIENNNINQRNIDELFKRFEDKNIKTLVVDLRYNGGGYVDAAVYIADKIINSLGKDKLMLRYDVNDYFENLKKQSKSTFKDVYFKKNNALNLETVCFIVSDNTASASEMLINVLKPYMNVKLVAEQTSTYGKPVGFFQQKIMNKIGLWVTSFALKNANGNYDYWLGINGDKQNVVDYIFLNFGDREEKMIAEALVSVGAVATPALRVSRLIPVNYTKKIKMGEVNKVMQKGALKKS